jgi:hypothetical protein
MMSTNSLRKAILLVEMLNLDEAGHVFTVRAFLRLLASTKRMIAGGATVGEIGAASAALERLKDRAKAELPNLSSPDRKRVQQALGWEEDSEDDEDDRVTDNPWELYRKPGWQAISIKLDAALADALTKLDHALGSGTDKTTAAENAYHMFLNVMDSLPGYGAGDTEPRAYLWKQIQRRIRNPRRQISL